VLPEKKHNYTLGPLPWDKAVLREAYFSKPRYPKGN